MYVRKNYNGCAGSAGRQQNPVDENYADRHPRDKKNHDDGNEGIGSGEGEDQQSWRNKSAEEKFLNSLIKKG